MLKHFLSNGGPQVAFCLVAHGYLLNLSAKHVTLNLNLKINQD